MTPTLTPPPDTVATFAAGERCDRCNAVGKLRIRLAEGGDLVFCGHHANKYAEQLVKIAVEVAVAPEFEWRGTELSQS
jgi:Zn ribbon nucleic-acid-binding protein